MVSKVAERLPSGNFTIALTELPRFSKDAMRFLHRWGKVWGTSWGKDSGEARENRGKSDLSFPKGSGSESTKSLY
jgi:hypothetical protein